MKGYYKTKWNGIQIVKTYSNTMEIGQEIIQKKSSRSYRTGIITRFWSRYNRHEDVNENLYEVEFDDETTCSFIMSERAIEWVDAEKFNVEIIKERDFNTEELEEVEEKTSKDDPFLIDLKSKIDSGEFDSDPKKKQDAINYYEYIKNQ